MLEEPGFYGLPLRGGESCGETSVVLLSFPWGLDSEEPGHCVAVL